MWTNFIVALIIWSQKLVYYEWNGYFHHFTEKKASRNPELTMINLHSLCCAQQLIFISRHLQCGKGSWSELQPQLWGCHLGAWLLLQQGARVMRRWMMYKICKSHPISLRSWTKPPSPEKLIPKRLQWEKLLIYWPGFPLFPFSYLNEPGLARCSDKHHNF